MSRVFSCSRSVATAIASVFQESYADGLALWTKVAGVACYGPSAEPWSGESRPGCWDEESGNNSAFLPSGIRDSRMNLRPQGERETLCSYCSTKTNRRGRGDRGAYLPPPLSG